VVALGVRLCGRWSLVASYVACGGSATIDSLRIKKEPLSSFLFFFLSLYSWTAAFSAPIVINYHDFLVLFSSSS
jgi:hypothetical protein